MIFSSGIFKLLGPTNPYIKGKSQSAGSPTQPLLIPPQHTFITPALDKQPLDQSSSYQQHPAVLHQCLAEHWSPGARPTEMLCVCSVYSTETRLEEEQSRPFFQSAGTPASDPECQAQESTMGGHMVPTHRNMTITSSYGRRKKHPTHSEYRELQDASIQSKQLPKTKQKHP